MGGICSADVVPDPPITIKPDPSGTPVTVQVAALGAWGTSRDYGVWEGARPSSSDEANKTVWLWFNKSNLDPRTVRIDLENFVRGHNPNQPKKGRVLYYAVMAEKPEFQSFQRIANSSRDTFFGFFGNNTYQDQEDTFYINHQQHRVKCRDHPIVGHIISKWSMNARVMIYDGDLGRGQASLQGQPILLEVFSKGTVVTSYEQWQESVEDHDSEGKVVGHHMETRRKKETTELVDRVEYRLSINGMMWCQWFCEGDATFNTTGVDPTIQSPLFTTVVGGGWFTRSYFNTTTSQNVDPALAMLISHVCATEYSVAQVKKDLNLQTPATFPAHHNNGLLGNGLAGLFLNHRGAQPTGNFAFNMNLGM